MNRWQRTKGSLRKVHNPKLGTREQWCLNSELSHDTIWPNPTQTWEGFRETWHYVDGRRVLQQKRGDLLLAWYYFKYHLQSTLLDWSAGQNRILVLLIFFYFELPLILIKTQFNNKRQTHYRNLLNVICLSDYQPKRLIYLQCLREIG